MGESRRHETHRHTQTYFSKREGHASYTYRHRNFGELLADAVLHDAPQIEGVVGLVWDMSPPLSAWLQLLP